MLLFQHACFLLGIRHASFYVPHNAHCHAAILCISCAIHQRSDQPYCYTHGILHFLRTLPKQHTWCACSLVCMTAVVESSLSSSSWNVPTILKSSHWFRSQRYIDDCSHHICHHCLKYCHKHCYHRSDKFCWLAVACNFLLCHGVSGEGVCDSAVAHCQEA